MKIKKRQIIWFPRFMYLRLHKLFLPSGNNSTENKRLRDIFKKPSVKAEWTQSVQLSKEFSGMKPKNLKYQQHTKFLKNKKVKKNMSAMTHCHVSIESIKCGSFKARPVR